MQAQQPKNHASIAPFSMQEIDGKILKASQLDMGRPVILICFSTDCDHCKNFTRQLLDNYKVIISKQVVMITWQSIGEVAQFSRQFNISAYHAIHIGTEGNSFTIPTYYNVKKLPFVALYKKGGALLETFEGEQPFNIILRSINKL
jgi:thiol-disulfide isomerase/thioredoxin